MRVNIISTSQYRVMQSPLRSKPFNLGLTSVQISNRSVKLQITPRPVDVIH